MEAKEKVLLCKNHSLVAYEICLYGAPMEHRLLCKICKQNLNKEELLEVISLTDFISGNFLTVLDSMIRQTNNSTQASIGQSIEGQIGSFFDRIEDSMRKVISKVKESAIKIARDSVSITSSQPEIEEKRNTITSRLAVILNNWEEKLYDGPLLDDVASCYSDLTNILTAHLNKSSMNNRNKDILLENFKVDEKNFQKLQIKFEKYLTLLIQQLINPEHKEKEIIQKPHENTHIAVESEKASKKKKGAKLDQEEKKVEKKTKPSTPTPNPTPVPVTMSDINSTESVIQTDEATKTQNGLPKTKCYHTLPLNHEYVFWGGLCYIEDKNHLVTGGSEGTIDVWDVESKDLLYKKQIDLKIYRIIYVKNHNTIMTTSDDGCIRIFDVGQNYDLTHTFQIHTKQVFNVVYVSNEDLYASCGEDGDVILWRYSPHDKDFAKTRIFDTNKKQVSSLCYVQDQGLLVTGMLRGGHLMAFQPEKTKAVKVVRAHQKERSIDSIIYVPEWKQLISGSEDSCIKFWDFSDFSSGTFLNCLKTIRRDNSYIESMAIAAEENYLFHTNLDPYYSIWDLSKDKLNRNVRGNSKGERGEALIYLKNRSELVTAFTDEIKFWKVEFT